ncbi:MAG TPA: hypothetical protein IAD32_01595 [Candidatus Scatavimonas merdigallinarum]|uniref:SipW-cognate class signal peptide n=1 Tax=Candidatus Scatavimonas merdigallinarum TaxID=2840914 RepID=A0A9D0ZG18_9FIRM|nr:hypothetical protein [Candidatus Scatavimonas merdigallinarum]
MENTKRTNKLLKVTLSVVALVLVAAVTYGITMAFLTARSNDKTNVFTAGDNVDIIINEPNYDLITDHTYKPGDIQDKDPSVENLKEESYIAMTVEFKVKDGTEDYVQKTYGEFKNYAHFGIMNSGNFVADTVNEQWFANANNADTSTKLVYYYKGDNAEDVLKAVATDASTEELFTKVQFNKDIATVVNAKAPDVQILVNAYAVQTTDTDITDLNQLIGI